MWSGWNGQACWIREIIEFDWGVFFVDGSVWVVPANGGKRADINVSSRRGWLVSKENVNSKSTESDKEDTEENQNGCGWIRHDDCWSKR